MNYFSYPLAAFRSLWLCASPSLSDHLFTKKLFISTSTTSRERLRILWHFSEQLGEGGAHERSGSEWKRLAFRGFSLRELNVRSNDSCRLDAQHLSARAASTSQTDRDFPALSTLIIDNTSWFSVRRKSRTVHMCENHANLSAFVHLYKSDVAPVVGKSWLYGRKKIETLDVLTNDEVKHLASNDILENTGNKKSIKHNITVSV